MHSDVINVSELVREVFIDPIRTMLVVDDDYPTLDDFIAPNKRSTGKKEFDAKSPDVTQLNEMLQFARGRDKPWLVDVHDGQKVSKEKEKRVAKQLHHSDLMVLDYNLEGEDLGGTAAIEILRELASNHHFNLVIVYTKGNGAGEVGTVLSEISTGLTSAQNNYALSDIEDAALKTALEKWEDEDEKIIAKLYEHITVAALVHSLNSSRVQSIGLLESDEGTQLKLLIEKKPAKIKIDIQHLLRFLLNKKQESLEKQLSPVDHGPLKISTDAKCSWISGEKLFVVVLSKVNCRPVDFETRLIEAIVSSYPTPHRLLLTKMRTAIDQRGLIAEAELLRDKHVQTAWLYDFLTASPADERGTIASTVNRHWDALGDSLKPDLQEFGEKLRSHFKHSEHSKLEDVIAKCGLSDPSVLPSDIYKKYNSFVSTKPIDRGHLTTGHVFRFTKTIAPAHAEAEPAYASESWICLTPACDMVPGQDKGWKKRLGTVLPFVAVRLHSVAERTALKNAQYNAMLFLDVDGSIQTFSIYGKEGSLTTNPEWEQMFAGDDGKFKDGDKLTLTSIQASEKGVSTSNFDAQIFAQLRSEYALNLLQKIGSHLSRPGLGMNFKKFEA